MYGYGLSPISGRAKLGRFPTAGHLASWAGLCPGNNESAGKHFSTKTRKGNPWLSGILTQCGWVASRTNNTHLRSKFWRIAKRRGTERAAVAIGHTILKIIWHILSEPDATYEELGADHYDQKIDPLKRQRRLVSQLEALDLKVTIEPAADAA